MELSQKVPDKEKKFGKFDDKISDKDAQTRNMQKMLKLSKKKSKLK
jgi:hypothetical protein